MPDSEANEPSKADLERRVDQLEATVQKMMPTRRGVLAGLAGAGIGGAAVYGATDPARAQAAGLQGTEEEPNDMWAWNLNVANQVTSDLPMNGNDVTGVGVMDVESLDRGQGNLIEAGSSWQTVAGGSVNTPNDTTDTSYTSVMPQGFVGVSPVDAPNGATVEGRFFSRMANSQSNEITFLKPRMLDLKNLTNLIELDELEVDVEGSFSNADTGWVELPSLNPDRQYSGYDLRGKVSGGESNYTRRWAIVFRWRVD